ncbi:chromosomal replication initiator protein DnaA [Patescibacteria group bacterium]|nr:chromosomal replication initiator protein DnaA [Patescibacteria group bacterium]MBU4367528.1 chromosomal replication initiator protein DnaA [Patescibacteria group bacterium]MBU4461569.1 chromosomal replication initiator protein DnaA [Patescibacteria group bacterium]MCG2699466.1 chromosomal replication initiator protein DnaA [Candidatus Parcubacteria bacterium]
MENKDIWQSVLAQIQFHISKANFATWFQNTEVISKKDGIVVVSVPNAFSKEWLSNKYNKLILKGLHGIDDKIKEVEYIIRPQSSKSPNLKPSLTTEKINIEQLNFEEFKVDKETNLNPRYTFDNFVVGSFNELAHAAALAVSENPGFTYNPLFIYGGVGLGKTHLLQAVGNKIIESLKKKKVKYISSEKFVTGIVTAIRNHSIDAFKTSLSLIDVLIIDDVQFLAGKNKTQEEFFHAFNALYEKNKQIILSSDRPPNAIPELEERLRSRFEGGMIADISLPDYETRLVILKTKLQEKHSELPEEILDYITNNVKKNIRELEGALNRLLIYYKINNTPPTLEVAKKLLKSYIFSPFDIANYKKIIEVVAKFYNLEEKDLFEATRRKEIVGPRQVAMFLLRKELKYSFPAIARKFGGKDHTTAIYACRKVSQKFEENDKLTEEINLIKQRIYSG